jgi:hypothetical protein
MSEWNFTPSSTGLSGPASALLGTAVLGQSVPAFPTTVKLGPATGVSTLPLSSTARHMMVAEPACGDSQV